MEKYVLTYDVGTTGVKTCIFKINDTIELLGHASQGYPLNVLPNGGVEQNQDDWWQAMADTSKSALESAGLEPEKIDGISFCSQMQGLVLVDKNGKPVRPAMSYMDQRATEELKKGIAHGPKIAGANIIKLLKSLYYTGAVALSAKDPVWKYKWVQANEPEVFKRVYKWLDVKESLICRMTDKFIMTPDSAFATLLYDVRKGKNTWSSQVCKMLGVNTDHLPEIVPSTQKVGGLTKEAAESLGLAEGTPVFGGGGDASLIGVGAGAVNLGDSHIYSGTSGWLSTVVDKSSVDASAMIAAIVGADEGHFNYFAELETAGKCLEWVKDHLALDEIGIYLEKKQITEGYEKKYKSLYDYMSEVIAEVEPGSGGVIFTPWLHGNRCPFEDPNARGMFFNISLQTGKSELIRSVVEGVCFHLRWFVEASDKKVKTSDVIRFVGGGALSDVTCQILADVTSKQVETVENPQNVGAVGAAVTVAVGLGMIDSIAKCKDMIEATKTFYPNKENKEIYDKQFEVFKNLYKFNKKNFFALNEQE